MHFFQLNWSRFMSQLIEFGAFCAFFGNAPSLLGGRASCSKLEILSHIKWVSRMSYDKAVNKLPSPLVSLNIYLFKRWDSYLGMKGENCSRVMVHLLVYLYIITSDLFVIRFFSLTLCTFTIYLSIVLVSNRQGTWPNAYHSSTACERATGDPSVGHGFGAAALRSNASHLFPSWFPTGSWGGFYPN